MKINEIKNGWSVTSESNDRGGINIYLNNDKTGQSASAEYALETGTDSSLDTPIPKNILTWLQSLVNKAEKAGVY